MRTQDNLVIVQPEDRQRFGHISRLVAARETDGRWGAVVVEATRSGGPPTTHIHRGEPEAFFVLHGDLEICGAESVTRVGPGSFILVPPDTEHTFRLISGTASWLAIWPSSLDGVLEDLEAARQQGRDGPETMAEIRRRHGTEMGRMLPEGS